MYYVYLLQSKLNNEIYTGSTTDLRKRFMEHNEGKEKSTKRYAPWKLIYYEAYNTERLARLREKRLKHNGNAIRELKKRTGLESGLPSTTFLRSQKSGAGFTLVELLVVIAIIGIISSLGIVNFHTNNNISTIKNNALVLLSNLEDVQARALAGARIEGEVLPPLSYGFIINDAVDFFGQGVRDCSLGCLYASTTASFIYLEDSNLISDLTLVPDGAAEARINFNLPRAKPSISLDGVRSNSASLRLSFAGHERCVTISGISGRMDAKVCE